MIEDLWYKNTIIYSLDLESFMDADGDGVGDFEGLIRRLDYLQTLGIETLWLNPFQRTPNRDNGYDITDYYAVDVRHGTAGDFVEFVHQARSRGIRVLMDMVVNHTSDEHPWFQQSAADSNSPYRDWYVWSKERPEDFDQGMVFPGVQEETWTYHDQAEAYYFHRFFDYQPDLNFDNPAVRHEIRRIIAYWLELGVAGFRMDAVPFMIESTKPGDKQGEPHFDYLSELRHFMHWRSGNAILLGEANVKPKDASRYFEGDGSGGLHMLFNFYVNQYLFYALATADVQPLREALEATRDIPKMAQWCHFLRNHDELDLGRLTKRQRQAVFQRFGPDENMQLYGRGIRRRLSPMLGERSHVELANSVMFSLPGTPVLRYGDEIGMGEDLSLDGREAVRTPMQWSDEANAGFSLAEETFLPVISDGIWSHSRVNVANQRRDPNSLFNWIARLIYLRKECPEIGWGVWQILAVDEPHVLAIRYDWRGNSVIAVHNFADNPCEAEIVLDVDGGERLTNLLVDECSHASDGRHRIALPAHGYRWYRVGGLNYALYRRRA